uniref:hypothetical chloroplast RF1 n=1 Tax=Cephaleuros parasiticus TaxID=173370 RepID=UPI001EDF50A8|nr:hypothetical chloroplast RF1 [Cephaleuros parasiticus]UIB39050.1 hypothetical chloroplast RF1 [Cephaleuros parasiticus]
MQIDNAAYSYPFSFSSKIFTFTFLLSITEQSCYFSYFGSLNLSSASNFLDTYIFATSSSPAFLIISCLGFALGSFLGILVFNYFFIQFFNLIIWVGRLDNFLLTCFLTMTFTTIPYFSFDYLFNQFLGIGLTPKNELLNQHNLCLAYAANVNQIYNYFGSNNPFYVGWDRISRKLILTSRFLSRPASLSKRQ